MKILEARRLAAGEHEKEPVRKTWKCKKCKLKKDTGDEPRCLCQCGLEMELIWFK